MSVFNRLIFLLTAIFASYQIVIGLDAYPLLPSLYFTLAFGVLVIACLILLIMGFEILENSAVVIISTLLPLTFSLGLITIFYPAYHIPYFVFALVGFISIIISRFYFKPGIATLLLATTHGIAGLIIFILPLWLSITGVESPLFSFVGIGGGLIGLTGLMLAFLKTGKPILSKSLIFSLMPWLLLLMTIGFVIGMNSIIH